MPATAVCLLSIGGGGRGNEGGIAMKEMGEATKSVLLNKWHDAMGK